MVSVNGGVEPLKARIDAETSGCCTSVFKCSPGYVANSRDFTGNPNGSVYLGIQSSGIGNYDCFRKSVFLKET